LRSQIFPNARRLVFFLAFCLDAAVSFNPFETNRARAQQAAAGNAPAQPVPSCPEIKWKSSKEFVESIQACRKNEETKYLEERYRRATVLMNNKDLVRDRDIRAFLLTPREKFCRPWNL
jgi:protein-L-isoaspartate(D-aspartate) O-methyltransferase